MIDKIIDVLPKHDLEITNNKELYLIDSKSNKSGNAKLLEKPHEDLTSIKICNENLIEIIFHSFPENAIPNSKQCEGVIYPVSQNYNDWMIFIEMKYTKDLLTVFKTHKDGTKYPEVMKEQVFKSIIFFRNEKVIDETKLVHGLFSFPNLLEEFSSFFFSPDELENYVVKHRIKMICSNTIDVVSNKRLKFNKKAPITAL